MLSDEEKAIEELKNKKADYFMISNLTGKTLVNLIEKQQKEIEELKENNKLLQKNYSSAHEDINWFCENYISKEVSEQKERKAYIKGINDAGELCNKKWEDKIKAKIEEKFLEAKGLYERGVQPQAQYTMKLLRDLEKSLLEKE